MKHKYKLKTFPMTGQHTIRFDKKVIHIQPGEEIISTPEEIGKTFLSRFEDLGEVDEESSKSAGRRREIVKQKREKAA